MAYSHRDLWLFLVLVVLFGGTFPAIKVGVEFIPPLLLAAARYYISGILLLGYAIGTRSYWRPRTRNDWIGVLAGGVLFIGGTGLSFVGIQFTTSGLAAIIFSLIPVLTVLIGWVVLPTERISHRGLIGVLVGFGGVALVVNPGASGGPGITVFGNLLVLLAAIAVTLGTVLVRRAHPPMTVVALTGWAMVIGATIQLGFSALLDETLTTLAIPFVGVLALGYLSVIAGGIGFVIYFDLLERFGALEVNLVTYLNPIVALVIGWFYLAEPIVPLALLGMGVVFAGFLLLREKELAAELAQFRGAGR